MQHFLIKKYLKKEKIVFFSEIKFKRMKSIQAIALRVHILHAGDIIALRVHILHAGNIIALRVHILHADDIIALRIYILHQVT